MVNATHAQWTWHQNPDLEPTIADSFWIVKGQSVDNDAPTTGTPKFRPGKGPAAAAVA